MNVIMFHSIGMQHTRARYAFLSFPYQHFEHFCRYLASRRISSGFLSEWEHNKSKGLPDKNVYLTFDDGFADNWVYVYPIARKYSVRFTIFVNPEFIQAGTAARKTMLENGFDSESEDNIGYLNWPELLEMQKSGLVDIQSHSMTHTWYPIGPQVIDIANPQDPFRYPWLLWNRHISLKADYLNNQQLLPHAVNPVFENGRSLGVRRHSFSEEQSGEIQAFLEREYHEGCDVKALVSRLNQFILEKRILGKMETDGEMIDRYLYELADSKKILEKGLSKSIEFLCWPGGAYNGISVGLSREVGYKASTLASKGDRNPLTYPDYYRIPRFGLTSFWYQKDGTKRYNKRLPMITFNNKYFGRRSLVGLGVRLVRKFVTVI
jgi:hypothetical protein